MQKELHFVLFLIFCQRFIWFLLHFVLSVIKSEIMKTSDIKAILSSFFVFKNYNRLKFDSKKNLLQTCQKKKPTLDPNFISWKPWPLWKNNNKTLSEIFKYHCVNWNWKRLSLKPDFWIKIVVFIFVKYIYCSKKTQLNRPWNKTNAYHIDCISHFNIYWNKIRSDDLNRTFM